MTDLSETSHETALQLLRWYESMGVDEAVSEAPLDWSQYDDRRADLASALAPEGSKQTDPPLSTRAAGQESGSREPTANRTSIKPITTPPSLFASPARELAEQATDLQSLEAALSTFDGCPLKKTAKNLCFARGNPKAQLMLIGEAPGRDEDLSGKPFVGRAGQLLDKMLAAIQLEPDDVYITNVVYWRPPGNRTPTPQEVQSCQPFLERQITLVAPDIIVLLGGAAAKQMLATDQGIMRLRGKWKSIDNAGTPVRTLATLHPAFLLRNPVSKRLAWRDLLMIRSALDDGQAE